MKMFKFFLCLVFSPCVFSITLSKTTQSELMTPRDLIKDSVSNIVLKNNGGAAKTVYGVYVRQYAYVTPGNSCDSATIIYNASQNTTAGSVVTPTVIKAGQSAAIGGNYLYNMIYQAIYYENIIIPSSPPGCALPGCTWGSDSTQYHWCIYLGALTPVSNSASYTANVPPSTETASGVGYNYNLISSYVYLGPISCNDQTLMCTVSTQQTQSFS